MMRLILLPLLLCTLSITCMAQTFQYSRGWTNGKRSLSLAKAQQPQQLDHQRYLSRDENPIDPELFEENFERYFMQLPRFMRNAILARSSRPTSNGGLDNVIGNTNNNLYGSYHATNELFDELNGVGVVETNDFPKH